MTLTFKVLAEPVEATPADPSASSGSGQAVAQEEAADVASLKHPLITYQIPPSESWLLAACEMGIPVYSPGWEDSTLGNIFAARVIEGELPHHNMLRSGTEQMEHLVSWYRENDPGSSIGFFQIGGGIAGDFAICAVPLILQDLQLEHGFWGYFCQISDSTTSYGSYSGAVPNEKITWFKLDVDTPRYMINSDASIVAPLVFAYVLGD